MGGPRVAIVGGGLAGAAAAWALSRRGARVTLCEREPVRGAHASGRNAGLIRRVASDPVTAELLRRGAERLLRPPPDLSDAPLYQVTGSVLLASGDDAAPYREAARAAAAAGLACEAREPAPRDLRGVDPGPPGEAVAIHTAEDGVADPHAVLGALWAAAAAQGATLALERPARLLVAGQRVTGVEGPWGRIEADAVLVAAGPWAAELAGAAGGVRLPLVSYRRHLFWTGPLPAPPSPRDPWVWDVTRGVYLRAESQGLLLCACDQDPRPPEDAQPDPQARDRLAERIAHVAPGLEALPLARSWAGLRGFVPDGRFVVGPDPLRPGLHWLTALGGHGLTAACAVGELCAAALLDGPRDPLLAPLSAARFERAAQEVA